jgi:hypothetical protein
MNGYSAGSSCAHRAATVASKSDRSVSGARRRAPPQPPSASASGTRQVGRADIDAIRELTHSYWEMDNRLGGGELRTAIASYLDDHVSRLLTTGSYQGETSR